MTQWVGRLFGLEDVSKIHSWDISFAAAWARTYPVLLLFAVIGVVVLGVLYYLRFQSVARHFGRDVMAFFRAFLLLLLLLIFAEPVISMKLTEHPKPLLLALFDGSDSMNIPDKLSDEVKAELTAVIPDAASLDRPSRLDLIRQTLDGPAKETLAALEERVRIRAYVMDRSDRVREIDAANISTNLVAEGQVTALGNALRDLSARHKGPLLAGVVVFSDFDKNAGTDPVAAARELEAPVFTVGVAPKEVVDIAVSISAPPVLKNDIEATVTVHLRQSGLQSRTARVTLMARRLGSRGGSAVQSTPVPASAPRMVELRSAEVDVEMPFKPTISGRYQMEVRVDAFPDEVLIENNVADRELTVRDDSLKLFFVEDEPSWEWRFVKEVFHRDEMVGREGFRTFLRAADYNVRRSNLLFEENLLPSRAEFFANDVILLSDVPEDLLTDRFQDMLEEYVKKFGGGLVVIAGPRYGLSELNKTRIGDMLPVVVEPGSRAKDSSFRLQITPEAADYSFMQLGADERENRVAWGNLGKLQWYQPVLRAHPLATVLATHPSERCIDNKSLQPIIATRRVEKGEVVYIGFNEMWRLRRMYGEAYYKQFWGQMIYRLGLGRALGSRKRFVVSTDRPVYQSGDRVRVTVEAYSLSFDSLNSEKLSARLVTPDESAGEGRRETEFSIPQSRGSTVFETTFPVYASGVQRLLVRDPETGDEFESTFKVAPLTIERRSASRNLGLQQALANETGGKAYELHQFPQLATDLPNLRVEELTEHTMPLWNTWLVLILAILLMFAEWTTRKLMNLR